MINSKTLTPRLALAVALAPILWLGGCALLGKLGADPVAWLLNQLGWVAIVLLLASLACTPLQLVLGWTWPLLARKTLGLAAFFWALAHAAFYVAVDQGFDLPGLWKDVLKHTFVFFGAAAFTLLVPLALTSSQWAQRRLGFRAWKRLHRLVYAAGALACVHYLLRFKLIKSGPVIALVLLGVLLGVRVWDRVRKVRAQTGRSLGSTGAIG